jgi:hypothetical protein
MMRILVTTLFSVVAMIGCGSDDPPPTCQEAMTHFYAAGCFYRDTSTQQDISVSMMITRCQETLASAPTSICRARFEDWVTCNNDVPDTAKTVADCDCSEALRDVSACE